MDLTANTNGLGMGLVHIIDDDLGMRKSLRMMMESASHEARMYASAEEFLEEMRFDRPGCIVLDLQMRQMDGIELLQRLRAAGRDIPVIIISGHADVPTAVRGMKLGAVDLLQKPFDPKLLLATVHRAIQKNVAGWQHKGEHEAIRKRLAELTARETDVLKLVVAGKSNKQIAAEMIISIKTVANHRAMIMAKTGALNGADLTRLSMLASGHMSA